MEEQKEPHSLVENESVPCYERQGSSFVDVSGTKTDESSATEEDATTHDVTEEITDAEIEKEGPSAIGDNFVTLKDVDNAIKDAGIEKCGLIIGIDYTISNEMMGQETFGGRSLHAISNDLKNPYQKCICYVGETFEDMNCNQDGFIYAFGFGDKTGRDKSIFPLKSEGKCDGFMEVLQAYTKITPDVKLGGPTNFAPLIKEAIAIVKQTKQYHILVILADGQVNKEEETVCALVEASNYPLSIVMIGIGDGPWHTMIEFDDEMYKQRKFDNFQFVNFHKVMTESTNPQSAMSLAALMEIPEQYKLIQQLD